MDKDVKYVLDTIMGYENIPRKRPKFINFTKNVMGKRTPPATIEKTWEVFEKVLKDPTTSAATTPSEEAKVKEESKPSDSNDENVNETNQGVSKFSGTASQEGKKSKKKRKREEEKEAVSNENDAEVVTKKKARVGSLNDESMDNDEVEASDTSKKFDWLECITELIEKKGEMKVKKLKKKVVNEFLERNPSTSKTRLELEVKFEKRLSKSKKFKVANDVVQFSTSRS